MDGQTGQRMPQRSNPYPDARLCAEEADWEWERMREARRRRALARRRRQRQLRRRRIGAAIASVLVLMILFAVLRNALRAPRAEDAIALPQPLEPEPVQTLIQGISPELYAAHPAWEENFLTVNEYSRPGETLPEVRNIFVHYTANRGTSAAQNRSYFEHLKDNHERSASAHFIIGYEGEIVQCIPLDEIAYAVAGRNQDSVSIECCYTSQDGSFTRETYDSLVALLDWLLDCYELEPEDILRHYDCGGKKCPIYFVEHESEWEQLKADVGER